MNNMKLRTVAIAILLALCGCESESIRSCGVQCRESRMAMKSYSSINGCECVAKAPKGDGQ